MLLCSNLKYFIFVCLYTCIYLYIYLYNFLFTYINVCTIFIYKYILYPYILHITDVCVYIYVYIYIKHMFVFWK